MKKVSIFVKASIFLSVLALGMGFFLLRLSGLKLGNSESALA